MMNWLTLCLKAFTDHKNRLDRKNYCLYFCLYFICYLIYIFFLIFIFSMFTSVRESHLGSIIILSMFILPMIGMVLFYIPRLMIRRMNDCNISRYWLSIPIIYLIVYIAKIAYPSRLLAFILLVSSITLLLFAWTLAIMPSTRTPNKFGPPIESNSMSKNRYFLILFLSTIVYLTLTLFIIDSVYYSFRPAAVDYYAP